MWPCHFIVDTKDREQICYPCAIPVLSLCYPYPSKDREQISQAKDREQISQAKDREQISQA